MTDIEHTPSTLLTATECKALRKQLGWTQQRLAKAMGTPQQSISRAERKTGLQGAHAKLLRVLAEICT